MLKVEMEKKLEEYEEILYEIGKWVNPQQYSLDETTAKGKLLFHIRGIKKELDEKFYKFDKE